MFPSLLMFLGVLQCCFCIWHSRTPHILTSCLQVRYTVHSSCSGWGFLWPYMDTPVHTSYSLLWQNSKLSCLLWFLKLACWNPVFYSPEGGITAQACGFSLVPDSALIVWKHSIYWTSLWPLHSGTNTRSWLQSGEKQGFNTWSTGGHLWAQWGDPQVRLPEAHGQTSCCFAECSPWEPCPFNTLWYSHLSFLISSYGGPTSVLWVLLEGSAFLQQCPA